MLFSEGITKVAMCNATHVSQFTNISWLAPQVATGQGFGLKI